MSVRRTTSRRSTNEYIKDAEGAFGAAKRDRQNAGFYFQQVQALATLAIAVELEEIKGYLCQLSLEVERLSDAADRFTMTNV